MSGPSLDDVGVFRLCRRSRLLAGRTPVCRVWSLESTTVGVVETARYNELHEVYGAALIRVLRELESELEPAKSARQRVDRHRTENRRVRAIMKETAPAEEVEEFWNRFNRETTRAGSARRANGMPTPLPSERRIRKRSRKAA